MEKLTLFLFKKYITLEIFIGITSFISNNPPGVFKNLATKLKYSTTLFSKAGEGKI